MKPRSITVARLIGLPWILAMMVALSPILTPVMTAEAAKQEQRKKFKKDSCPKDAQGFTASYAKVCEDPKFSHCCETSHLPMSPATLDAFAPFAKLARKDADGTFRKDLQKFMVQKMLDQYVGDLMLSFDSESCGENSNAADIKKNVILGEDGDFGMGWGELQKCSKFSLGDEKMLDRVVNTAAKQGEQICKNKPMDVPARCGNTADAKKAVEAMKNERANAAIAIFNIDRQLARMAQSEEANGNVNFEGYFPTKEGGFSKMKLPSRKASIRAHYLGKEPVCREPVSQLQKCFNNPKLDGLDGAYCKRINPTTCLKNKADPCTAEDVAQLMPVWDLMKKRQALFESFPSVASSKFGGDHPVQDTLGKYSEFKNPIRWDACAPGKDCPAELKKSLAAASKKHRNERLATLRELCDKGNTDYEKIGEYATRYPDIVDQYLKTLPTEDPFTEMKACQMIRDTEAELGTVDYSKMKGGLAVGAAGLAGVALLAVAAAPVAVVVVGVALSTGAGVGGMYMTAKDYQEKQSDLSAAQGLLGACFLKSDNLTRAIDNLSSAKKYAVLDTLLNVGGMAGDAAAVNGLVKAAQGGKAALAASDAAIALERAAKEGAAVGNAVEEGKTVANAADNAAEAALSGGGKIASTNGDAAEIAARLARPEELVNEYDEAMDAVQTATKPSKDPFWARTREQMKDLWGATYGKALNQEEATVALTTAKAMVQKLKDSKSLKPEQLKALEALLAKMQKNPLNAALYRKFVGMVPGHSKEMPELIKILAARKMVPKSALTAAESEAATKKLREIYDRVKDGKDTQNRAGKKAVKELNDLFAQSVDGKVAAISDKKIRDTLVVTLAAFPEEAREADEILDILRRRGWDDRKIAKYFEDVKVACLTGKGT